MAHRWRGQEGEMGEPGGMSASLEARLQRILGHHASRESIDGEGSSGKEEEAVLSPVASPTSGGGSRPAKAHEKSLSRDIRDIQNQLARLTSRRIGDVHRTNSSRENFSDDEEDEESFRLMRLEMDQMDTAVDLEEALQSILTRRFSGLKPEINSRGNSIGDLVTPDGSCFSFDFCGPSSMPTPLPTPAAPWNRDHHDGTMPSFIAMMGLDDLKELAWQQYRAGQEIVEALNQATWPLSGKTSCLHSSTSILSGSSQVSIVKDLLQELQELESKVQATTNQQPPLALATPSLPPSPQQNLVEGYREDGQAIQPDNPPKVSHDLPPWSEPAPETDECRTCTYEEGEEKKSCHVGEEGGLKAQESINEKNKGSHQHSGDMATLINRLRAIHASLHTKVNNPSEACDIDNLYPMLDGIEAGIQSLQFRISAMVTCPASSEHSVDTQVMATELAFGLRALIEALSVPTSTIERSTDIKGSRGGGYRCMKDELETAHKDVLLLQQVVTGVYDKIKSLHRSLYQDSLQGSNCGETLLAGIEVAIEGLTSTQRALTDRVQDLDVKAMLLQEQLNLTSLRASQAEAEVQRLQNQGAGLVAVSNQERGMVDGEEQQPPPQCDTQPKPQVPVKEELKPHKTVTPTPFPSNHLDISCSLPPPRGLPQEVINNKSVSFPSDMVGPMDEHLDSLLKRISTLDTQRAMAERQIDSLVNKYKQKSFAHQESLERVARLEEALSSLRQQASKNNVNSDVVAEVTRVKGQLEEVNQLSDFSHEALIKAAKGLEASLSALKTCEGQGVVCDSKPRMTAMDDLRMSLMSVRDASRYLELQKTTLGGPEGLPPATGGGAGTASIVWAKRREHYDQVFDQMLSVSADAQHALGKIHILLKGCFEQLCCLANYSDPLRNDSETSTRPRTNTSLSPKTMADELAEAVSHSLEVINHIDWMTAQLQELLDKPHGLPSKGVVGLPICRRSYNARVFGTSVSVKSLKFSPGMIWTDITINLVITTRYGTWEISRDYENDLMKKLHGEINKRFPNSLPPLPEPTTPAAEVKQAVVSFFADIWKLPQLAYSREMMHFLCR